MDSKEIIEKLRDGFGIIIDEKQTHLKKPFFLHGKQVISLYKRELQQDFYFVLKANGVTTLFKVPKIDETQLDYDERFDKYIVPSTNWYAIWEEKEFVELPDESYFKMTLRDYACIHLKIPETNYLWLNELIKKAR